jgi:membrane protease YdiL (CAAX protease family)
MREAAFRIQRKITESEDGMHEMPVGASSSTGGDPSRLRNPGVVAPWWHAGAIAVLLVGLSVVSGRQAHSNSLGAHHAGRYLFGIGSEWALLLFAWWGLRLKRVRFAELLGFRSGLRALAEDVGAAAIFWIVALVVLATIGLLLRAAHLPGPEKTLMTIAPRTRLEMLLWIALSLSAGFCEEFVFRGYFLRQFASLGAGMWVGVLGSSLLFGVSHGYEGAAGMIAITAFGAMFCALAIARGSLRPGMMAHAWHDIFSGAMLALLRHFHPM